jgi:molybdate transport system regulatory protein
MKPRVKAWIVFPGGTKFGEGRAELLRRIDEEGSLRRAVAEMEMSYRAAWGYLRELESAAGFAFLEHGPGGPRSGTRLTKRGRAFLDAYEKYRSGLEASRARAFRKAFGGPG